MTDTHNTIVVGIYEITKDYIHMLGANTNQPTVGTLCVRVSNESGENFYFYRILVPTEKAMCYKLGFKFGAYGKPELVGRITERNYFLLRAGEEVFVAPTSFYAS